MKLTKESLKEITNIKEVSLPKYSVFSLPEKVLQFGTGVFIRGLIDYYIDKANNQGIFNGRVVVVKSTKNGSIDTFKIQDNLYTLLMKSIEEGEVIEETVVCGAISRVLNASDEWTQVLKCAANPQIEIIISNTTEVGITLIKNDQIDVNPPFSYPAKLLSFLYERFKIFKGSDECGMVIVPTELIPNNAKKLQEILNTLAKQNNLSDSFIKWLNESNEFCNSLVDRIVPGKPSGEEQNIIQKKLGYEDDLMIMSESYALWAIEALGEKSRNKLKFSKVHHQIFLVPNIDKFIELKLRLLNGSHNLSCALGVIAGFKTVKDAMANPMFNSFMETLIQVDIAKAIVSENITLEEAKQFGSQVLDRYRNPFIEFDWLSICVEDTSKIKIRAVPIVLQYFKKYGSLPKCISLSFAAYILFMKSEFIDGKYIGRINNLEYQLVDEYAENLHIKWQSFNDLKLVYEILKDEKLWGHDLSKLFGFPENVNFYLKKLTTKGFFDTVEDIRSLSS